MARIHYAAKLYYITCFAFSTKSIWWPHLIFSKYLTKLRPMPQDYITEKNNKKR